MKELETHSNIVRSSKNNIELNVKDRKKVEHSFLGNIPVKTGHFLWEINEETGEIKKAEYKRTVVVFGGGKHPEELIVRPDCVYIPALNKKNAIKKYLKNKEQGYYFSKPPAFDINELKVAFL